MHAGETMHCTPCYNNWYWGILAIASSPLCQVTVTNMWYLIVSHYVKDKNNYLHYLLFSIWGCASSAYPIFLWWSWECVLYLIIIIKSEVWNINHCLGLGHETMVCAVCFTMFLCAYLIMYWIHVSYLAINTFSLSLSLSLSKHDANEFKCFWYKKQALSKHVIHHFSLQYHFSLQLIFC